MRSVGLSSMSHDIYQRRESAHPTQIPPNDVVSAAPVSFGQPFVRDHLMQPPPIMPSQDGEIIYGDPMRDFLQDMDFSWDLNFDDFIIPQVDIQEPSPEQVTSSTSMRHHRAARDPSRGHAAFKRSPWLWEPQSKDYVNTERENLVLKEVFIPQPPYMERLPTPTAQQIKMLAAGRDRLFAMVLNQNKDQLRVPSFPPLELLNYLLQTHFVQEDRKTDCWIHTPSFEPATATSELLGAIVANGSQYIAVPAIWQFGMAMQEVARISLSLLVRCSPEVHLYCSWLTHSTI